MVREMVSTVMPVTMAAVALVTVPATATVRYGILGFYNTLTGVTASISCNNSVFGDPIIGLYKQCQYRLDVEEE